MTSMRNAKNRCKTKKMAFSRKLNYVNESSYSRIEAYYHDVPKVNFAVLAGMQRFEYVMDLGYWCLGHELGLFASARVKAFQEV